MVRIELTSVLKECAAVRSDESVSTAIADETRNPERTEAVFSQKQPFVAC